MGVDHAGEDQQAAGVDHPLAARTDIRAHLFDPLARDQDVGAPLPGGADHCPTLDQHLRRTKKPASLLGRRLPLPCLTAGWKPQPPFPISRIDMLGCRIAFVKPRRACSPVPGAHPASG